MIRNREMALMALALNGLAGVVAEPEPASPLSASMSGVTRKLAASPGAVSSAMMGRATRDTAVHGAIGMNVVCQNRAEALKFLKQVYPKCVIEDTPECAKELLDLVDAGIVLIKDPVRHQRREIGMVPGPNYNRTDIHRTAIMQTANHVHAMAQQQLENERRANMQKGMELGEEKLLRQQTKLERRAARARREREAVEAKRERML